MCSTGMSDRHLQCLAVMVDRDTHKFACLPSQTRPCLQYRSLATKPWQCLASRSISCHLPERVKAALVRHIPRSDLSWTARVEAIHDRSRRASAASPPLFGSQPISDYSHAASATYFQGQGDDCILWSLFQECYQDFRLWFSSDQSNIQATKLQHSFAILQGTTFLSF